MVRSALGLEAGSELKIAYLPGPGNLHGTFQHWKKGELDPGVPSIAYSTMFFELLKALGAQGLLVRRGTEPADPVTDGDFTFATAVWNYAPGPISYHRSRYLYVQECLKALRKFRPHVAIVSTDLDWQYLPLVKRTCPKLVLTVHNTIWPMAAQSLSAKQKIGNFLIAQWLKAIDSAVCTSHECERQILKLTQHQPPSFVAVPQQIEPAAEGAVKTGPARRLLYLGRIEEPKGVFDLLEAVRDLRKTEPDLHLVYAGGGGRLDQLKSAVADAGMQKYVDVLGHLTAEETHDEISKADLLVCPTRTSFNEGLAFVCFEAAAHGVPTVMSSVVPAQDLLGEGCAVYPADETEALKSTLAHYIADADAWRAMATAAKANSKILFDRSRSWGSQVFKALVS